MSDGISEDFIIRTRSLLWREVARQGGSKELARAHVNLPPEAVKALDLDSKRGMVAFIMRNNSKSVILTNMVDTQARDPYFKNDPQILLETILSKVITLKLEKKDLFEDFDNREISVDQFTKQHTAISNQLDEVIEKLKNSQLTQFRGSNDHLDMIINTKIKFDLNLYANSIFDYLEDLIQNIRSNKNVINSLELAYSKGLIEESEYNQEKKDLESKQKILYDILEQSRKILTQNI